MEPLRNLGNFRFFTRHYFSINNLITLKVLNTQTEELKAKWEDSSRNEGLMSDLKEMMTNEEQKIIHIKVRFKFCDKYHCLSDAVWP